MRILETNKASEGDINTILIREPDLRCSDMNPGTAQKSLEIFGEVLTPRESVERIVEDVRTRGDEALKHYSLLIDGINFGEAQLEVSSKDIEEACNLIDSETIESIELAFQNIEAFCRRELPNSWFTTEGNGIILGQRYVPLDRAGIYVPGGTARYPSSVLMNAVPARVAGVREIIMVSPPDKNGNLCMEVLFAAKMSGVDRIFKIGGAQAIAALAFGTESVPRVDKITGPGNIFVTLAKRHVYGYTGIDMLAGPSEIIVIADETAPASYVAADLLSQAEHDANAGAILITHDLQLAQEVSKEIDMQLEERARKDIINASLDNSSAIIVTDSLEESIELANKSGPEHLEIMIEDPWSILDRIKNAGAVFLGPYSSEPVGDYIAGTNHILPTNGTSRFFSPLGVFDFLKRSSVISYSKNGLDKVKDHIIRLAERESLDAHANAIKIRD